MKFNVEFTRQAVNFSIKARGDLYALRAFCEEREDNKKKLINDNRKKELIDMLLKGRKENLWKGGKIPKQSKGTNLPK